MSTYKLQAHPYLGTVITADCSAPLYLLIDPVCALEASIPSQCNSDLWVLQMSVPEI